MTDLRPEASAAYVVAPKRDGPPAPADWPAAVAAQPGVTETGRFLGRMRVEATPSASAALRELFSGALHVEPLRSRSP